MSAAIDYSAGAPDPNLIVRAGYVGAVRYIGFPDNRKCTTRNELEGFSRAGLGMALVFEQNVTNWRGGEAQGRVDGRRARDHANAIGFPADRPVYMATDQDVVTSGEFDTMIRYLYGAGLSLGGAYVTGVYGEADVIDRARAARVDGQPVCTWFWQTAAWSRGRRTAAHLFQRIGAVTVGGVTCDVNDVLADDWGQHNARRDMERNDIIKTTDGREVRFEQAVGAAPWSSLQLERLTPVIARIEAKLDAGFEALSDDEANIIAAVRALPGGDPAAFATALAPILAPMIQAGISKEDARAAALDAVETVFARAADRGEGPTT